MLSFVRDRDPSTRSSVSRARLPCYVRSEKEITQTECSSTDSCTRHGSDAIPDTASTNPRFRFAAINCRIHLIGSLLLIAMRIQRFDDVDLRASRTSFLQQPSLPMEQVIVLFVSLIRCRHRQSFIYFFVCDPEQRRLP